MHNITVLKGLLVLVVEDESLVAMELAQILGEAGCIVLGPVTTVDAALHLLGAHAPAAALLDVQLLNGMSTPVAERLRSLAIPFVLVSGYTGLELQKPALAGAPRIGKPIDQRRLLEALATAMQSA